MCDVRSYVRFCTLTVSFSRISSPFKKGLPFARTSLSLGTVLLVWNTSRTKINTGPTLQKHMEMTLGLEVQQTTDLTEK
uniref:Uncharacterized protein n=1 Tax=Anguilla anguilla TaxID=7936 RepID=A0A0E9W3H1_ANGAN